MDTLRNIPEDEVLSNLLCSISCFEMDSICKDTEFIGLPSVTDALDRLIGSVYDLSFDAMHSETVETEIAKLNQFYDNFEYLKSLNLNLKQLNNLITSGELLLDDFTNKIKIEEMFETQENWSEYPEEKILKSGNFTLSIRNYRLIFSKITSSK